MSSGKAPRASGSTQLLRRLRATGPRRRARKTPRCCARSPPISVSATTRSTARSRRALDRPAPCSVLAGRGGAVADRRRHGRAAGGAGAAARCRETRSRKPDWQQTRAVLDWIERDLRPAVAALRRGRDRRAARRPRRAVRRARPVRRAEPRPARGAADRPQFLFGRHARGADPGGLAARLEIGGAAGRAPRPGTRRLSRAGGAVGLGHRQHAHRRRRHRPGVGADGRAAGLGAGERPGDRVRDHAGFGARPAAGRCHVARVGLFPRRVSRA